MNKLQLGNYLLKGTSGTFLIIGIMALSVNQTLFTGATGSFLGYTNLLIGISLYTMSFFITKLRFIPFLTIAISVGQIWFMVVDLCCYSYPTTQQILYDIWRTIAIIAGAVNVVGSILALDILKIRNVLKKE
jgi:hypothetical protein